MSRGTRMLLIFILLIGTIGLMMDCAKKSMRKKHQNNPEGEPSQGYRVPAKSGGEAAFAVTTPPGFSWRV